MTLIFNDQTRRIITISGPDRYSFLQGLITNDINRLKDNDETSIYTALLTPQGKYLHDFFIIRQENQLLLDIAQEQAEGLVKRLNLYKLRSQITITTNEDPDHVTLFLEGPPPAEIQGTIYQDPRLESMGYRGINLTGLSGSGFTDFGIYDRYRLKQGIPDSQRDLVPDRSIPMEYGFEELNGISWNKGCYMGQELIARTKHRGVVRKRILPISLRGDTSLQFDDTISHHDKAVGRLRSVNQDLGLALFRLELIKAIPQGAFEFRVADNDLCYHIPSWFVHDEMNQ